ncbi:hypothetical protein DHEL01_v210033 [Diaporthe helianthi]|uniref:Ecp2 effector protein domain-containing protein n=1 Tax=Diaporthe helianthi TaxID=158607 RepID=A0A2P5HMU1_DIAHE|nr:hypothetical protein DHEL01_v210033 [Diaporthe helianthi]
MKTAKFSLIFSAIFGLITASPVSMTGSALQAHRSLDLADDHRLCTAPDNIIYKHGNQTNPDGVRADCDQLSQNLKTRAGHEGKFSRVCQNPAAFRQFGKEGDCTLWFRCGQTTEGKAVTIGYGDVANIMKLATDGLQGLVQSENSSTVAVSMSIGCQYLTTDWVVALGDQQFGPRRLGGMGS